MKIKKKANAVRVPPLKKAIKIKRNPDAQESTVQKALRNVKKVLEEKQPEPTTQTISSPKPVTKKVVKKKIRYPKCEKGGVVYLGHIPHGFYEDEIKDYFKQFGYVTRVRVARSKHNGKSRGYGFVEFRHPDVAKIAAETMNNYLMCGRLLKATYIPPEKQHTRYFAGKSWTKQVHPAQINRNRTAIRKNRRITEDDYTNFVKGTKEKLHNLQKKLKEKGINIKFKPADKPQI